MGDVEEPFDLATGEGRDIDGRVGAKCESGWDLGLGAGGDGDAGDMTTVPGPP